ncbi:MAG: hypothetical protein ACJ711_06590, partial [Ornithinibacter sp.]
RSGLGARRADRVVTLGIAGYLTAVTAVLLGLVTPLGGFAWALGVAGTVVLTGACAVVVCSSTPSPWSPYRSRNRRST